MAEIAHIWLAIGTNEMRMRLSNNWEHLILCILVFTLIRRAAISWVSSIVNWSRRRKDMMFNITPVSSKKSILNPLSALMESPISKPTSRNPLLTYLPEVLAVNSSDTKVMSPSGDASFGTFRCLCGFWVRVEARLCQEWWWHFAPYSCCVKQRTCGLIFLNKC